MILARLPIHLRENRQATRDTWYPAWRWARMVKSKRWRFAIDPDREGPEVPMTAELLATVYPDAIFRTHRLALAVVLDRDMLPLFDGDPRAGGWRVLTLPDLCKLARILGRRPATLRREGLLGGL